jgi:hypothetical protein
MFVNPNYSRNRVRGAVCIDNFSWVFFRPELYTGLSLPRRADGGSSGLTRFRLRFDEGKQDFFLSPPILNGHEPGTAATAKG